MSFHDKSRHRSIDEHEQEGSQKVIFSFKGSSTVWVGRLLSGLFVLFMLGASIAPKLLVLYSADPQHIVYAQLDQLGWPHKYLLLIAGIELAGTILYVIPRTSVLGALLMTGLLGGAIATQLRVDSPLLTHILFGTYLGLLMWGGLWLRDPVLRALLPVRSVP